MNSIWTIWLNAHDKPAAERLLGRVSQQIGVEILDAEISPYHKGGYKAKFLVTHDASGWSDIVVECLKIGQRVAREWRLYGDVLDDVNAISNTTSVSGVDMIEWQLHRVE